MKNYYLVFLFLSSFFIRSQTNADSLLWIWNSQSKPDTVRLKALNSMIIKCVLYSNPDSALKLSKVSFSHAQNKGLKYNMAIAQNLIGGAYLILGNNNEAIVNFEGSFKLMETVGNKEGMANALNNIGSVYMEQGNLMMAISIFTKTLKIREAMGDKTGQAAALINIGTIYRDKRDIKKSIDYYLRCIEILKTTDDKQYTASVYGYLANGYTDIGETNKAKDYLNKAIIIEKEIGNEIGLSSCYGSLGIIAYDEARMADKNGDGVLAAKLRQEAIDYYNKCIELDIKINNVKGIAVWSINLAECYYSLGQYQKAIKVGNEGLKLALETNTAIHIKNGYETLYVIYKAMGDTKNALKYYELFIQVKDTLMSQENQNEIVRQEVQYNMEKKNLADSLAFVKEKEVNELSHETQLDKEKNQKYVLYAGLAFALVIGGVTYRGYQQKKKDNLLISQQKKETESQKELIEEKNNEILDSITYAKRIQEAILPPLSQIRSVLPNSFVLYKPKDIVAGDFYWVFSGGKTNFTLIAVADCTGHGVPGALVSVVCANALNNAVKEFGLTEPAKILDKVNELIEETFNKSGSEVKDGMDISLAKVELVNEHPDNKLPKGKLIIPKGQSLSEFLMANKKYKVQWAGANNPLWYIKDGIWQEVKADKQPVGKFEYRKPFTNHNLELKVNDSLFLISDGFADQFGGKSGKKIKYRVLKEILFKNSDQSPEKQMEILDNEFMSWKGSNEQVDDVTIMGVKL